MQNVVSVRLPPRSFLAGAVAISATAWAIAPLPVGGPVAGASDRSAKAVSAKAAALEKAIIEAMAFVEKERGLTFKSRPKIEILEDGPFIKRLDSARKSDPAYEKDTKSFSALLRSLAFVRGDGDPEELLDALLSGAVGGFYDPTTKVLVVRSANAGPLTKAVIVHELVHALEDQHFGLERPELKKRNDDSAAAFQFLAEGSARYIENKYRSTFTKAERSKAAQEEMAMDGQDRLFELVSDPDYVNAIPFMFAELLAPYELGKGFVADLVRDRGRAGLDEAFRNPPTTTEQVLDVKKYLAKEPAKVLARPDVPAGATIVDNGVVGMASIDALLATPADLADIEEIGAEATGWGGDSYVVWDVPGKECFRMDVVMDTPTDRAELRAGLAKLAAKSADAKVEDRANGVIRFTSCGRA
jgi:hypothetical protein